MAVGLLMQCMEKRLYVPWELFDSLEIQQTLVELEKKVVKKISKNDNTNRTKWMNANQDKVEVFFKKKTKWHSSFLVSTSKKVWRQTGLRICILTLFYLVTQRKYVTTLQRYLELSNRNRPELIRVSCLQCTSKILDYRGLENLS